MLNSANVIYPELSYKIVGVLFSVHNELGSGLQEKYYQRAVAVGLNKIGLVYAEQVMIPIKFKESNIGRYYLDFLIEDKIILEIKRGEHFALTNIQQVLAYLKSTGLQLGILANFTQNAVKYKRILNIHE